MTTPKPPSSCKLLPPAPPSFDSAARRDYMRFQIGVWSFFGVLGFLAFIWDISPLAMKPYVAIVKAFELSLMALCSHALWLIGRRRRWLLLKSNTARLRGLAVCLAGAAIVTAITFPFEQMVFRIAPDAWLARIGTPLLMFGNWVGASACLIIWGGLYCAYYYQAQNRWLETERARLLAATREAQLIALKGQINPHFLFNSLNTLRALIQGDPVVAREAVTHLADMMRYSLTMSGHSVIPLADEVDFVNDYLALEHLRHEDRLRIQKTITPESLNAGIPPMLLQTLVENAVKHGLSQRSQGILVTCEIRLIPPPEGTPAAAARLHLRVTNQGRLRIATAEATGDTGTGLRNIRERLRLLYGDRASLTLVEQDGLVVAEAVVPLATRPANAPPPRTAGASLSLP